MNEPAGEALGLSVRNLTKAVQDGEERRHVLGGPDATGIDLEVQPGEMVAVMGPSGSGKSTLLKIVAGIVAATDGSVTAVGYRVRTDAPALRRKVIGYIEQRWNLISGLSAAENVALPLELGGVGAKEAARAAEAALADVGLDGRGATPVARLSGGEQQRVAIARALIGTRRIVVADEPTASLDSVTGDEIMRLLRRRCDATGAAVLMATHNAMHAAYADRIVYLRDGVLTEQAATPSLFGDR